MKAISLTPGFMWLNTENNDVCCYMQLYCMFFNLDCRAKGCILLHIHAELQNHVSCSVVKTWLTILFWVLSVGSPWAATTCRSKTNTPGRRICCCAAVWRFSLMLESQPPGRRLERERVCVCGKENIWWNKLKMTRVHKFTEKSLLIVQIPTLRWSCGVQKEATRLWIPWTLQSRIRLNHRQL